MRRAVTLDARGIELDLSEEGDACIVYAISADGSFIDIIDEFQDLAVAKTFAVELAQKHDLPLIVRHVPLSLGDHWVPPLK
jgi:hypothetical protein